MKKLKITLAIVFLALLSLFYFYKPAKKPSSEQLLETVQFVKGKDPRWEIVHEEEKIAFVKTLLSEPL